MSDQPLLQGYNTTGISLRNRVVMAPLTRCRADNPGNVPTDLHVLYYSQRAGAGLIVTEGSQVSSRAVGYINTPGIFTEEQVNGWKKVTMRIHEKRGKIFCQLWHVGRVSHPDFHNGKLPLAPSAINPNGKSFTPDGFKPTVEPKAMTLSEIHETIADFKKAGENAMLAGFDGVEIHASNGYLFHQFLNRTSNKRKDEYGGSIVNRTRFLFEVLDALCEVMSGNRIGVRFNPTLHNEFLMQMDEETIPTFEYVINRLNDYNIAYIHLSEPTGDVSDSPYVIPHIAAHFRPIYNGTIIINNRFDREKGNRIIQQGAADLVSYGKPFISNPDLVDRFRANVPLQKWDKSTFYAGGKKGYTDYAAME